MFDLEEVRGTVVYHLEAEKVKRKLPLLHNPVYNLDALPVLYMLCNLDILSILFLHLEGVVIGVQVSLISPLELETIRS